MNREDYMQLRNQNKIEEIIYKYYVEKGGTIDFQTVMKSNAIKFLNIDSIIEQLDFEYGVTLLLDEEKLIKVM